MLCPRVLSSRVSSGARKRPGTTRDLLFSSGRAPLRSVAFCVSLFAALAPRHNAPYRHADENKPKAKEHQCTQYLKRDAVQLHACTPFKVSLPSAQTISQLPQARP
jgi:hypothetical protein